MPVDLEEFGEDLKSLIATYIQGGIRREAVTEKALIKRPHSSNLMLRKI